MGSDERTHVTVRAWFDTGTAAPAVVFPDEAGRPELTARRDPGGPSAVTVTATFEDCTVHLTADAAGGILYHFHPTDGELIGDSPWTHRTTIGVLTALGSLAVQLTDGLEYLEAQAVAAAQQFSRGTYEYRAVNGQTMVELDIDPAELNDLDPIDPVAEQLLRKVLARLADLD